VKRPIFAIICSSALLVSMVNAPVHAQVKTRVVPTPNLRKTSFMVKSLHRAGSIRTTGFSVTDASNEFNYSLTGVRDDNSSWESLCADSCDTASPYIESSDPIDPMSSWVGCTPGWIKLNADVDSVTLVAPPATVRGGVLKKGLAPNFSGMLLEDAVALADSLSMPKRPILLIAQDQDGNVDRTSPLYVVPNSQDVTAGTLVQSRPANPDQNIPAGFVVVVTVSNSKPVAYTGDSVIITHDVPVKCADIPRIFRTKRPRIIMKASFNAHHTTGPHWLVCISNAEAGTTRWPVSEPPAFPDPLLSLLSGCRVNASVVGPPVQLTTMRGLEPGTTYFLRYGSDANGWRYVPQVIQTPAIPSAPTDLSVSALPTPSGLLFTWTPSAIGQDVHYEITVNGHTVSCAMPGTLQLDQTVYDPCLASGSSYGLVISQSVLDGLTAPFDTTIVAVNPSGSSEPLSLTSSYLLPSVQVEVPAWTADKQVTTQFTIASASDYSDTVKAFTHFDNLNFALQYRIVGDTAWITSTCKIDETCVEDNLTRGATYEFAGTAAESQGDPVMGQIQTVYIKDVPPSPEAIVMEDLGSNDYVAEWGAVVAGPNDPPVTSYTIEYRKTSCSAATSSCWVKDLNNADPVAVVGGNTAHSRGVIAVPKDITATTIVTPGSNPASGVPLYDGAFDEIGRQYPADNITLDPAASRLNPMLWFSENDSVDCSDASSVQCLVPGSGSTGTTAVDIKSESLPNLSANASYQVRVCVRNEVGCSEWLETEFLTSGSKVQKVTVLNDAGRPQAGLKVTWVADDGIHKSSSAKTTNSAGAATLTSMPSGKATILITGVLDATYSVSASSVVDVSGVSMTIQLPAKPDLTTKQIAVGFVGVGDGSSPGTPDIIPIPDATVKVTAGFIDSQTSSDAVTTATYTAANGATPQAVTDFNGIAQISGWIDSSTATISGTVSFVDGPTLSRDETFDVSNVGDLLQITIDPSRMQFVEPAPYADATVGDPGVDFGQPVVVDAALLDPAATPGGQPIEIQDAVTGETVPPVVTTDGQPVLMRRAMHPYVRPTCSTPTVSAQTGSDGTVSMCFFPKRSGWFRLDGPNMVASRPFYVTVNVVAPTTVQNYKVAVGSGSVSASWKTPALDGGADIVQYKIQVTDVTPNSTPRVVTTTALKYKMKGLAHRHSYTVAVSAKNSGGFWSVLSTKTVKVR